MLRCTTVRTVAQVGPLLASVRTQSTLQTDGATRILVTGAMGQIGTELTRVLRARYGAQNVIATDVQRPDEKFRRSGPFQYLNVLDANAVNEAVVTHNTNWILHLASILSAAGERNPLLAMDINVTGTRNVLEAAKNFKCRVFAPSTIAAFGPSSPKDNTPDECIMRPTTMYGLTKVHLELLGDYYKKKFGVDFRSVRYPGIISSDTLPGGGTTDYAIDIFYEALKNNKYKCFLKPDTSLPMMHMPDCLKGTVEFIEAPVEKLTQTTYNLTAISFTPAQLAATIQKVRPGFTISYEPDFRQAIADSWPRSLDDSKARKDWGWKHSYGIFEMVNDMLEKLSAKGIGKQ